MNKQQAKKHAYGLAADFIQSRLGNGHYDENLSDEDNERIARQLQAIAEQLERRGELMGTRPNRVWQEDDFG